MKYAMSRRRRNAIMTACILLAGVIVFLDRIGFRHPPKSQTKAAAASQDFAKYHEQTFRAVKVVDGDTLDVDVPDGKYNHTRIRLWGVDTPETKKPGADIMYFGPEAANFTTKLALGKQVTVYLSKERSRDKYGRLLAYVQLPDGGFLNEVIILEGFGYADLRFKHNFYNKYVQLEAVARSQKKGLWEKVTREQLPDWLRRERPGLRK